MDPILKLEDLLKTVKVGSTPSVAVAAGHDPDTILAIAKAVNALYMAVWSRLLFLRGARGLAKERSMLLEDIDVIEAAVPTTEQLERIERNRRYLERCVDYKLRQIERVRALRNQGKRSKIKSVA